MIWTRQMKNLVLKQVTSTFAMHTTCLSTRTCARTSSRKSSEILLASGTDTLLSTLSVHVTTSSSCCKSPLYFGVSTQINFNVNFTARDSISSCTKLRAPSNLDGIGSALSTKSRRPCHLRISLTLTTRSSSTQTNTRCTISWLSKTI